MDAVLVLLVGALVVASVVMTTWPEQMAVCPATITYTVTSCSSDEQAAIASLSAEFTDLNAMLTTLTGSFNQASDDFARQSYSVTSLVASASALSATAATTLQADLAPLQTTLSLLSSLSGSQACAGLKSDTIFVQGDAVAGRWVVAQPGPLIFGGSDTSAWTELGKYGSGIAFSGYDGANLLTGVLAPTCSPASIASSSCTDIQMVGHNGQRWWQSGNPGWPSRTWG